MKSIRYILASLVCLVSLSASAQNLIRHNYKSNGYTYVGTERVLVKAGSTDKHPFYQKLDYIVFPDGETAYILELDFEEPTNINFPKEVELKATTLDGKFHTYKQYAGTTTDKHQFTAADGKTKVYWNVGKYMLEESDLQKLISGVKNLEVTHSWGPDGFYSFAYSKNEFSSALKSQYDEIKAYVKSSDEIGDIIDYVDNLGSTTIVAKPVSLEMDKLKMEVRMSYLYYKSTNSEDYDLTLVLSGDRAIDVPHESEVEVAFEDGSTIKMKQEREGEYVVYLYPTIEQTKKIVYGKVSSIKFPLADGHITQKFTGNEFSKAVSGLYNTLQAVSVL